MSGESEMFFGPIELDPCSFVWPLFRGATPRIARPDSRAMVVIPQPGRRFEEFATLPYLNDLTLTCMAEDGTRNGETETLVIPNVRLIEVRQVSEFVCELHLQNMLIDLANRICPADFNILYKDGYLPNTYARNLMQAYEWLGPLLVELAGVLDEDAFAAIPDEEVFELHEGLNLAGLSLPYALDLLSDRIGIDPICTINNTLAFAMREGTNVPVEIEGPNWIDGKAPTWYAQEGRALRGLPKKIAFYYPERHALALSVPRVSETIVHGDDEVKIELEQVYRFDGKYGVLSDMLEFYGFASNAITDAQIADKINTANFERTQIEGGLFPNAFEVIATIRDGWHSLVRIMHPEFLSRAGAWTDRQFGTFEEVTTKDGFKRYTGDLAEAGVLGEWTEYLAVALDESNPVQQNIIGVVVAKDHRQSGTVLPVAPFTAIWENESQGVIRLVPKPPASATTVWLGRMSSGPRLVCEKKQVLERDDGGVITATGDEALFVPTPADVKFDPTWRIELRMVARRRMPNTTARYTRIEYDGFEDGDVEVLEVEVEDDLFALRGLPADGTLDDGLGLVLNQGDLDIDSHRRERVLRDALSIHPGGAVGLPVPGEGEALGLSLAATPIAGAISAVSIDVEYPVMTVRIDVHNWASEKQRLDRLLAKRANRAIEHGGKVLV